MMSTLQYLKVSSLSAPIDHIIIFNQDHHVHCAHLPHYLKGFLPKLNAISRLSLMWTEPFVVRRSQPPSVGKWYWYDSAPYSGRLVFLWYSKAYCSNDMIGHRWSMYLVKIADESRSLTEELPWIANVFVGNSWELTRNCYISIHFLPTIWPARNCHFCYTWGGTTSQHRTSFRRRWRWSVGGKWWERWRIVRLVEFGWSVAKFTFNVSDPWKATHEIVI